MSFYQSSSCSVVPSKVLWGAGNSFITNARVNQGESDTLVTLNAVVSDIADSFVAIDSSRVPFRAFKPGVGPYGEPQLLRKVALTLNSKLAYLRKVETRRAPDLLIRDSWGLEFKIVRPFGDNGKEAED